MVQIAASLAILHFNIGSKAILKVLNEMGCTHGYFTILALNREDGDRQKKGKKKETEEERKRRKFRRRRRKGLEDNHVEQEGETYSAGAF